MLKIHKVISKIEHPSVLEVFKYLETEYPNQLEVVYLPVTSEGMVDLQVYQKLLKPNIGFISVMHANNETGVLQPIQELVHIARKTNTDVLFHTDASQSIGKTYVDIKELRVDLLSVCPHKFYGPKGIGALFIKQGCEEKLEKQIHGANHEKNLRAGTENVLEIVGLGKACEMVSIELEERMTHFRKTRNIIYRILIENLGNSLKLQGPPIDFDINTNNENRLSNTLFISFPGAEANLILDLLSDKIACSAGAACHSDDVKMSHVLEAMKVAPSIAMGTLRLSTGLKLTIEQAEKSGIIISDIVKKLLAQKNKNIPENEIIESEEEIRLTKTTHGLGCGCKLSATLLTSVLKGLPKQKLLESDHNILVGTETGDDCCVYKLTSEIALIKTLDFFTPICDNPEDFGAIACANSLSDIYAMGGKPLLALNIVGFPIGTMPTSILKRILLGSQMKAEEAGVAILGGHSIEDTEPKFGLSVTGIAHPNFIWKNSTMEKGDFIIITKKLGVGTIMTGLKRQIIGPEEEDCKAAMESMKYLNKYHCECLMELEGNSNRIVNACTDITGFGLLGHLKEGLENSQKAATIYYDSIPFFEKAKSLIEMGVMPGGTVNNCNFVKNYCFYEENITSVEKNLLNDAQTSGGLMIFVSREKFDKVCEKFNEKKLVYYVIGEVEKEKPAGIYVKKGEFITSFH